LERLGWGSQIVPRIGIEVIAAFIDGDPGAREV
jgi:uncharacterized protein involved in type VI secretion and phage assembly